MIPLAYGRVGPYFLFPLSNFQFLLQSRGPLHGTLASTLSGTLSQTPSPLWLSFLGTLGTPARFKYSPPGHKSFLLRLCPLVLWSFGPLVPWSLGPLVPWSLGPLVPSPAARHACKH